MTTCGAGFFSSNCRSDGSPARAETATWYQPGIAQVVCREHSSSERLDDHVIATFLVTS